MSATPPSIAIAAPVLGGPESARVVCFTAAAASIQAQHKHQCRLADAERTRDAEEARRKAMVQKAHQLGTGQPLRLPSSARDRIQVQEAKHARRRAKEDRRKASHARGAALR